MEKKIIKINGLEYDISHLDKVRISGTAFLHPVKLKKISIEVHFSNHCYSESPAPGTAIPIEELVEDGSIQKPRNRITSLDRYNLSLNVLQQLKNCINNGGTVSVASSGNFHFSPGTIPNTQDQIYIFFRLTKVPSGNNQVAYIKLVIESVYTIKPPNPVPSSQRAYSFNKLLGSIWAP